MVAPEVKSKPMAASAPPVAPEVRSKPIAASAPAVVPEVKSKPVAPAPPASKATAAIQPPPAKSGAPSSTTALAGMFPALHLQALVYSDVPAQRMVFINGRKYVEGQEVDAGLVLDEITEQGALLSYRGRRYLLREDRDQN